VVSQEFRSRFKDRSFSTAISTRWRFPRHINIIEVEAYCLAVRHVGRSPGARGHRALFCLDSSVALGYAATGGSGSHFMNVPLRRVAVATMLADIRPMRFWIPTDLQPTDGPYGLYEPSF
jgi:hypothetical protein